MNRQLRLFVSLLYAAFVLRMAASGDFKQYVKPGMQLWLVLAGLVLGAVSLAAPLHGRRARVDDHDHHPHDHDHADADHAGTAREAGVGTGHEHPLRVGWLLVLPVVAVFLIAPGALGSYSINRATPVAPETRQSFYVPVPKDQGPVPMSLYEFVSRAYTDDGVSLEGASIRLKGFVGVGEQGKPQFRLARYLISCCAADARVAIVLVDGPPPPATEQQWYDVEGVFAGWDSEYPLFKPTKITPVAEPEDPYE